MASCGCCRSFACNILVPTKGEKKSYSTKFALKFLSRGRIADFNDATRIYDDDAPDRDANHKNLFQENGGAETKGRAPLFERPPTYQSNFSCFHALQTRAPVILDSTFFSCFARLYHRPRRTYEKLFKPYVRRFNKFSPQRNHLCGNPKTFYGSIRSGNRN